MEEIQLDTLKPNPKNPRQLSKHDGEALAKSMKEFGDLSAIVFNEQTQQLVGGHQRINVLQQVLHGGKVLITQRFEQPDAVGTVALGYVIYDGKQFPYRAVKWPLDRELAANIAANRIQGTFDLDLLAEVNYMIKESNEALLGLTGQTEQEIDKLMQSIGASTVEEDDAPEVELGGVSVSSVGSVYQLGRHRLMCGDSTDFGAVSDLMNGVKADMVFTDPPYGVSYQSNRTESEKFDVIQNDDKLITGWIEPVLAMSNGFIFMWTSWKVLDKWLDITKEIGKLTNMIIWDKGGGGIGDLEGTYASDYEVALVFNRGAKLTGQRLGSVWSIGKDAASIYEHPTQKPVELAATAIKSVTNSGNTVLDVFGGSGSTLIACEQTGRISYTMELDPKYCDVIRKRYHKLVTGDYEGWEAGTPAIV